MCPVGIRETGISRRFRHAGEVDGAGEAAGIFAAAARAGLALIAEKFAFLDDFGDAAVQTRERGYFSVFQIMSATVRLAGMKGRTCSEYGVTTSRT